MEPEVDIGIDERIFGWLFSADADTVDGSHSCKEGPQHGFSCEGMQVANIERGLVRKRFTL